jgi:hypothetical protein
VATDVAQEIVIRYDEAVPSASRGSPGTERGSPMSTKSIRTRPLADAEQAFGAAPVKVDAERRPFALLSERRPGLERLYLADCCRGRFPSFSAWAVSPRRSFAFVRRKCSSFSFGVC